MELVGLAVNLLCVGLVIHRATQHGRDVGWWALLATLLGPFALLAIWASTRGKKPAALAAGDTDWFYAHNPRRGD